VSGLFPKRCTIVTVTSSSPTFSPIPSLAPSGHTDESMMQEVSSSMIEDLAFNSTCSRTMYSTLLLQSTPLLATSSKLFSLLSASALTFIQPKKPVTLSLSVCGVWTYPLPALPLVCCGYNELHPRAFRSPIIHGSPFHEAQTRYNIRQTSCASSPVQPIPPTQPIRSD
jgi:hypothetical protein